MRRAGHLFDRIVDRENLRWAAHKALKGKRAKVDARLFMAKLDEHLALLGASLLRGDIRLGEAHQFTIFDPKQRLITAPCFRERVLHHAIMNVCEPYFDRRLVADTFACRKGLGRLSALGRTRQFARRHAFFLKLDIRRYFDSISHEILFSGLRRLFKDPRLLDLLGRIIASRETSPGRGLPIGALTSQHFANFYLGSFDRFVKEGLRIKGYVRYMDDCALWAESPGSLRDALKASREFLRFHLALDLKPEPYINRTSHGMDFLGCRVFPGHMTLGRRARTRFRRKLNELELAHATGRIDERELQQRATALAAFASADGVSSWRFRRSVVNSRPEGDPRPRTG